LSMPVQPSYDFVDVLRDPEQLRRGAASVLVAR